MQMRPFLLVSTCALTALTVSSCVAQEPAAAKAQIRVAPFGKTTSGESVDLYTITNANGAKVAISTYGGVIVALEAPDRNGRLGDVVLGFDAFDDYAAKSPYFGALIGRYGNRIGKARFQLDGVEYKLATNNGASSLHGGRRGFDKVVWKARQAGPNSLELSYLSKDGEEGYPGNLDAKVTYTWSDANELRIDYRATTDKNTVVNLTNHSYFNLKGAGEGDVTGHVVTLLADRFTPVDKGLIPTGELRNVAGTPFDFRQPRAIGAGIDSADEQIAAGGGYDHNWVLNRAGSGAQLAARVLEPESGRVLEVSTTEPGLQFYTGNFLNGTLRGKGGKTYPRRGAFCMETQHFPDSPNRPEFPSTTLKAGAVYQSSTTYKFSSAAR